MTKPFQKTRKQTAVGRCHDALAARWIERDLEETDFFDMSDCDDILNELYDSGEEAGREDALRDRPWRPGR